VAVLFLFAHKEFGGLVAHSTAVDLAKRRGWRESYARFTEI